MILHTLCFHCLFDGVVRIPLLLCLNHYYNIPIIPLLQMEGSDIAELRELKQAYLRDHIESHLQEDFVEYCSTQTESIDIDSWSLEFIKELVAKFKQSLADNFVEEVIERSFAMYQTMGGEEPAHQEEDHPHQGSILDDISEIIQPSPEKAFAKKKEVKEEKPQTPQKKNEQKKVVSASPIKKDEKKIEIQKNNNSAVDLLDEVFEKSQNTKTVKNEHKKQDLSKSFFDSSNFWDVPKLNETMKDEKKTKTPSSAPERVTNDNHNKKEIQIFQYSNLGSFEYFNTCLPNQNKNPMDEFNTFSVMTDQQIKKKKQNNKDEQQIKKKEHSKHEIKIKEVKKYDPETEKKETKVMEMKESKKRKKHPISKADPNRIKNDFQDKVTCMKSTVRPLLGQNNLTVKIVGHQIISRSIFSSNYLMYDLKITPNDRVCKRNYEDFSRLRGVLGKVYPGIQLPYLEKEGWISDTSDQFARKQGQVLELFMTDILSIRQIKNSRIIEDFLTFPDHKKMKRKFEQYDKMDKLKSIEELCLIDGKVQVSITENERVYKEESLKYLTKTEMNLQKFKKLCESLNAHYSQGMVILKNISDVLKQMVKQTEFFNDSVHIKQFESLEDSIKKIRKDFIEKYNRMGFQKKVLEDDILPFLRYEKENLHVSREIVDFTNSLTTKYNKRNQSEAISSTDSYLSNRQAEFKNGVAEQSKSLIVLKYQVGYWQSQTSTEIQRIMEWLGTKIDKNWQGISQKYLDEFAKSVNIWSLIA